WPDGLLTIEPAWDNFVENPKAVQFVHRMFAYGLLIASAWHMVATFSGEGTMSPHARRALVLFLLMIVQAAIGIVTLLGQVPLYWALTHQAMALIVLGFAAAHWRGTKGAYPMSSAVRTMH